MAAKTHRPSALSARVRGAGKTHRPSAGPRIKLALGSLEAHTNTSPPRFSDSYTGDGTNSIRRKIHKPLPVRYLSEGLLTVNFELPQLPCIWHLMFSQGLPKMSASAARAPRESGRNSSAWG